MHRTALIVAFLAVVEGPQTTVLQASGPALTVRVYNTSLVSSGELADALATAQHILGAAGVPAQWLDCKSGDATLAVAAADVNGGCSSPMSRTDVTLRIVTVPMPHEYRGLLPMGESVIERRTHSGSLATIYAERVAWLARAGHANGAVLMGRAIAHEIGHLLLGTNAHAGHGLMRARWSEEELRREMPVDWVFARGDARRIRESLLARTAEQSAANHIVWSTAPSHRSSVTSHE